MTEMTLEQACDIIVDWANTGRTLEKAASPSYHEAVATLQRSIEHYARNCRVDRVSPQDREEVVNDVLFLFLRKNYLARTTQSLRAYIFRCVRNHLLRRVQRETRHTNFMTELPDGSPIEAEAPDPSPEEKLEVQQAQSQILQSYQLIEERFAQSLSPTKQDTFLPRLHLLYLYTFQHDQTYHDELEKMGVLDEHGELDRSARNRLEQHRSRLKVKLSEWFQVEGEQIEEEMRVSVQAMLRAMDVPVLCLLILFNSVSFYLF